MLCRKLFFASVVLVVGLTSVVLAGYRPVARWDVVPDQRLDSVFNVGVVAFHASGVKVEFRVGGTLVYTANNPTLNSRTDVWEFWFALDPSGYSDGPLTIDARAIPLEADPNSYDLPSRQLYANSGGSLSVSTVKWADSVNGSDSNPGTESQPYETLAKAVQNTPSGGLINLKAGTYSPQSLGGGSSRPYWTTIQSAPGVSRDDVELGKGRPGTQRLKLKDLTVFSNSTSGDYDTILDGEQGSHSIWLDNVKAYNKNGRWAASTTTFGNIYVAYLTGGLTTQVCNGPGGSIVRNHTLDIITSDAWTGGGKLVVNCTGTDIDPGSTGAHPDYHQSYSPAPNWCENVILYNVSGYSCLSQGLFGHRLKNSAFVNVLFERHPDTVMYSQYSEKMVNDLFFHINIINQTWLWRGTGAGALDAYNLKVYNSIFGSMSLYEDASEDGMEIDYNHFSGSSMGTNKTLGDPQYVDPSTSDYQLQSSSPAYGTGKYLQCVPADIDGVAFDSSNRNRGCYAASDGNVSPVADAGTDQNVTDTDENGSEVVTLDGSGSYDSDGTIESYVWKEGVTQIATGESPNVTLDVGQHTITLTVTDNDSATDTDDVVITVSSPDDTTAPSPDPMTWATEPYATGSTSISMTATTATDASGVEYYFDETSGNPGGSDSGWQDSSTYQDTGLNASTQYTYRVKARDKSTNQNETAYSTSKSATTSSGGGEPTDIDGHTADTSVNSGGGVDWNGAEGVRVGGAETTGIDKCVVYVFELPTLTSGQSITAANLSFYLESYSYYAPAGNADLYGIAYRSGSSVQSSDWYQGAYDGDSGATALQDNIMLSSSPEDTTINSDSSGDNALKAYLNAQYDAGATGGDYVFLRVNADIDETYNHYWVVSMANNATAGQRPVLTVTIESAGDTTPPNPDPMTWATVPYNTGTSSISMTATTATDASGVEYYFDETSGNPGGSDSGWQDSTTYTDTGLDDLTQYTYRVKARDKSSNYNETAYSTSQSATTQDGTAPSPDPMTWATEPYATGTTSISMMATTATDASGVEYYFDCTAGGGTDSGWQDSTTYEDTGLSPSTQYTYQVKARDKSNNYNETGYSTSQSATTDAGAGPNLVSWWKLDESSGTTAADSSGNGHDGTRSGGSWAPTGGKFDGAVDLGAANTDHVEVPTTSMSASASTISVWGRIEGTQSGVRYFFGHTSSPPSWVDRIQLYMDGGDNQLDLGLGDSHEKDLNIMTLSADTWYHIALTWDSGDYVVYVDGLQKASGTYTGLSSLGSIADIGNTGNSSWRDEGFQGKLDDVRVYNQALSKYDIADLAGITIASNPSPADQATGVSIDVDMSWSSGYYAADVNGHDVYLGTDFNSVADANQSSAEFKGNQDSNTYDPGTMSTDTTYYWAIDEVNDTNTWPGDVFSFTTAQPDTTAPSPDPMTWATDPYATGTSSISMTATTATDASSVEYYFEETSGNPGGSDSGWQDSTTYEDTGLSESTQYTYKVRARDKSANQNATGWSTAESATTDSDPNLTGWWKLDESSGTTAADSSGNSHDGTRTGGSWAPTSGKIGGAVDIGDANSDRVQVPTTGMSASAGTISLWGRLEGTQSEMRYFFGHTSGSTPASWPDRIQIYLSDGDNQLDLGLGDTHTRATNIQTLSANTWYHIALTWDGSNYIVYVDGVNKANGSYTGLSTLNSIADIGNDGNAGYRIESFQGLLDQARIYDRVLSQSEVEALASE